MFNHDISPAAASIILVLAAANAKDRGQINVVTGNAEI